MKRFVIFLFLCLACIGLHAENVIKLNGEEISGELAYITFDAEKSGFLKLHFSDGTEVDYNMNLVEVLPNAEPTAISSLKVGNCFRINQAVAGELLLTGADNSAFAIYNANGACVLSGKASGEETVINTSRLSAGVYVIRIDKKAVKFIKK